MAPTPEKIAYFSSRRIKARLKMALRLLAIQRSDIEGRNISMEEVHNDVLALGIPLAKAKLREQTQARKT